MYGYGCGPTTEPRQKYVSVTLATQCRIASLTASFRVRLPLSTECTSAPSSFMRNTLSSWRATSTAPMYTVHSRPISAAAVARRHAVLAGAGVGDDALLAHPFGEQRLADHVVDLVRPGVVEVLALEDQPDAELLAEVVALGHDRRTPGVLRVHPGELGAELGVGPGVVERGFEFLACGHEGLGHEPSTELAEAAGGVGRRRERGA